MSEINWKSKYEALKAKFMESVDTAFRLGHEQGQQQAQTESVMQQQQQEADQLAAQANGMGEEGQDPNQDPNAQEQAPPDSENPAGSELDKHINELEGMLSKSEVDPKEVSAMTIKIKNLRKSMIEAQELKKSHKAISGIALALHKPKFKIGVQANHNLTNSAKKAVSMQESIVNDIMKNWEEESKKTGNDILSHLKAEGILPDKKG